MSDEEILQQIYTVNKELYRLNKEIGAMRKELHNLVEVIKKGGK